MLPFKPVSAHTVAPGFTPRFTTRLTTKFTTRFATRRATGFASGLVTGCVSGVTGRLATAALAGFTLTALALPAQAKGYSAASYIALDGTALSIDDGVADDITPLGLRVRLGTRLGRNLDLEAQFGGGSEDTVDRFDEVSASYIGLYAKGYLPLGRYSALFGLAGASAVEISQTINNREFDDDKVSLSYGVGLETQLTNRLDLSADFMQYSLEDDAFSEVSAFNLGLKYYF